jgi:hypothetical protein
MLSGVASRGVPKSVATLVENDTTLKESPLESASMQRRSASRACVILTPAIEPERSTTKVTFLGWTSRPPVCRAGAKVAMK